MEHERKGGRGEKRKRVNKTGSDFFASVTRQNGISSSEIERLKETQFGIY